MSNVRAPLIDLGIHLDGSVDYWYDEGFLESRRRLELLSEDEWAELQQIWPTQPVEWKERLVYILGDNAIPREVELLMIMFTNDSAVSQDAAAALREIEFERLQSILVALAVVGGSLSEGLLKCVSVNELLNTVKSSALFPRQP